jgi:polyhydroxyalkanoate synthase
MTQNASHPDATHIATLVKEIANHSQGLLDQGLQQTQAIPSFILAQLQSIIPIYQSFLENLLVDPLKLSQTLMAFWQEWAKLYSKNLTLWTNAMWGFASQGSLHQTGNDYSNESPFTSMTQVAPASPEIAGYLAEIEKLFTDHVWIQHPLFSVLKQFYFLVIRHVLAVVDEIIEPDKKLKKRLRFYINQAIQAFSPTNFFATNPDALRTASYSHGKNVLEGLQNMLHDLESSHGQHLHIHRTDLHAFSVGTNLATTPGKVIYQNDLIQLIQYQAKTPKVFCHPLLIVPPWINKYYILDLTANNSLVQWLVMQGYTVFMISWVNPERVHAHKDLQDYMFEGPLAALNVIEKVTGQAIINTLGFCIGGTLLAITLAYMRKRRDLRVASATYLTTLLDFTEPGDLGVFIDETQFPYLQRQVAQEGYFDGNTLSMVFNLLRPNELIWYYFKRNYLEGKKPIPNAFLFWNADPTNLPAKMFITYLQETYLNNHLILAGGFKINNTPIDLSQIDIPTYFLSTEKDHIAPWRSTYHGKAALHSGATTFVLGGAGHVAGVVNPPTQNKYGYYTNETHPRRPEQWLKTATFHSGSWWSHWGKWLAQYSGPLFSANNRATNSFLDPLEDAPGSYVQKRLLTIE